MKAVFTSKFQNINKIKEIAKYNAEMISEGKELYLNYINLMEAIHVLPDHYMSVSDIYDALDITAFKSYSKRKLYGQYEAGIVVGAGSGNDCIDIIDQTDRWFLFDLMDERMIKCAVGYKESSCTFNKTGTRDGDTITNVSEKYNKGSEEIRVTSIDGINFDGFIPEIISLDVEGSAMDVLSGANQFILEHQPDLLVSIYHNWIEYLLAVPFLYDMGYKIEAILTTNFLPHQPHLELSLYCTSQVKK